MKSSVMSLIMTLVLLTLSTAETQFGYNRFGNLKYKGTDKHVDYLDPNAPKGGEFTLAVGGTFDSLNVFLVKGNPTLAVSYVHATLMGGTADEVESVYSYVAEKIEADPENNWVIFHLNPKAKFNNGKQVTTDDVIFSYETLKNEKGVSPTLRKYLKLIKSAEVIAPGVVKFHFETNQVKELPTIAAGLPILSKEFFTENPFNETSLKPFPVVGPYEIEKVDPGRSVTLRRVKNWWGENLLIHKGANNFDRIHFVYYRDDTAMFEAFKSGRVSARIETKAQSWATMYDFPAIKNGQIKREVIKNKLPAGIYGLYFNMRRPIFKDLKVRKALTRAFNFYWLNKHIFYSAYTRNRSIFPRSEMESKGLPEGKELELLRSLKAELSEEVFEEEFKLPRHNNTENSRQILQECQEILKQAGWVIKDQKLVNAETGQPFTFEVLINDASFKRIVLHYKETLEKLGINLRVRLVDANTYQQRLEHHDYDMVIIAFAAPLVPGNEQRVFWGSQNADVPGALNISGIRNDAIDELIGLLLDCKTYEDVQLHARALDRFIMHQYPMIPAWHSDGVRLAYWDRFNLPKVSPSYASYGLLVSPAYLMWSFNSEKDAKLRGIVKAESQINTEVAPKEQPKSFIDKIKAFFRTMFSS